MDVERNQISGLATNETVLDSTFRSFHKSREHPVLHIVGEPVFVEIFVLKHEAQDLVLLLDDCWATPSADPQDKHRWNLLHEG